MANVQLNFQGTAERLTKVFTAFAKARGWTEQVLVDDVLVPNPVSIMDYCKDQLKLIIRETVIKEKSQQAKITASQAAIAEVTDDAANIVVTIV